MTGIVNHPFIIAIDANVMADKATLSAARQVAYSLSRFHGRTATVYTLQESPGKTGWVPVASYHNGHVAKGASA